MVCHHYQCYREQAELYRRAGAQPEPQQPRQPAQERHRVELRLEGCEAIFAVIRHGGEGGAARVERGNALVDLGL